jgi:integrase
LAKLCGKTRERYRELAEQQINPHLGPIPRQRLRPSMGQEWHKKPLLSGSRKGGPLSPRTVGHAHRLLRRPLPRAVKREELARNVPSVVSPSKVEAEEIEILDSRQIGAVLDALEGHPLCPIVDLASATGMRRGKLLGLQLGDLELDRAYLRNRT